MRGDRGGQANLQVQVRLIDPLNHIQSVDLLYAPAGGRSGAAGPDAEGSWSPLPQSQTINLTRNGAIASASFSTPTRTPGTVA